MRLQGDMLIVIKKWTIYSIHCDNNKVVSTNVDSSISKESTGVTWEVSELRRLEEEIVGLCEVVPLKIRKHKVATDKGETQQLALDDDERLSANAKKLL